MRMTQRKFKEYVEKNLTGITDRELFTSEYLRSRLERMATAITDRYKRPVRVRLSWGGDAIAYTDHSRITTLDRVLELTRYRDRPARFQVILGLLAHEIAHILYSGLQTEPGVPSQHVSRPLVPEPAVLPAREVRKPGPGK